jgi:hypothetical protein
MEHSEKRQKRISHTLDASAGGLVNDASYEVDRNCRNRLDRPTFGPLVAIMTELASRRFFSKFCDVESYAAEFSGQAIFPAATQLFDLATAQLPHGQYNQ